MIVFRSMDSVATVWLRRVAASVGTLVLTAMLAVVTGCTGTNTLGGAPLNTDSVVIEDLVPGTGLAALSRTPIDQTQTPLACVLVCTYTGRLKTNDNRNGDVFDSSTDRGGPVRILLGTSSRLNVTQQTFVSRQGVVAIQLFDGIRGVQMGLQGMQAGGTRRITVPPSLATPVPNFVGTFAQSPVPSNTTLVYDVQLLQVIQVPAN